MICEWIPPRLAQNLSWLQEDPKWCDSSSWQPAQEEWEQQPQLSHLTLWPQSLSQLHENIQRSSTSSESSVLPTMTAVTSSGIFSCRLEELQGESVFSVSRMISSFLVVNALLDWHRWGGDSSWRVSVQKLLALTWEQLVSLPWQVSMFLKRHLPSLVEQLRAGQYFK